MSKNMTSSNDCIKTGNFLLDQYIEKGIPQGNISMIIGKSRQTGKSMYMIKMMSEWRKSNRLIKIKSIFDKLENNS